MTSAILLNKYNVLSEVLFCFPLFLTCPMKIQPLCFKKSILWFCPQEYVKKCEKRIHPYSLNFHQVLVMTSDIKANRN